MFRRSPYVMVAGISLLLAAATGLFVLRSKSGTTNLAFWFDSVSDDARKTLPGRLPDGLSLEDMKLIEAASREEIVRAFLAYPISIVGRVAAHYQVRVVDGLTGPYGGSAESYAFPGFGGQGFVSFRSLAHGAIVHAPPEADRQEIVAAIGRGIGRAAVHEFTHQLLGRRARIDDSTDVHSYEYGSTTRPEQYDGQMRWDIAEPLLRQRFGMD